MSSRIHKYFIQEHLREPYQNGGIGYTDAERILVAEGYKPVFLPGHFEFSVSAKIRRLLFVLGCLFWLPSGSVIVFLLPQHAAMNRLLVKLLGFRRTIKRVAILGDINGIKHNDPHLLRKELKEYSRYDFLIVHNQWMKQWIEQEIPGKKCSMLHFFDFLAEPSLINNSPENSIAYAGNLEEAGFLDHIGELGDITFKVYGQPFSSQMAAQANLEYAGTSDPYALPKKIRAAYGLVWYGNSIDAVLGNIGPYLSIISPHKASLYLLCGIPLIVPEGTAIAGLVRQFNAGVVIDTMHDLPEKLHSITVQNYQLMCDNARKIASEIAAGNGLRGALAEMEKALGGGPFQ